MEDEKEPVQLDLPFDPPLREPEQLELPFEEPFRVVSIEPTETPGLSRVQMHTTFDPEQAAKWLNSVKAEWNTRWNWR